MLPVWLLLCPRDYLSSFLKIGTVALLVTAVIVANPQLKAPSVNPQFAGGGGPNMNGAIFPFCFMDRYLAGVVSIGNASHDQRIPRSSVKVSERERTL